MRSDECKIRVVSNGYILQYGLLDKEEVHTTLDSLFEALLMIFEGKAPEFIGSSYGSVQVKRGSSDDPLAFELEGR